MRAQEVASQAEGFTGAEVEALCREAALAALREDVRVRAPAAPALAQHDRAAETDSSVLQGAAEVAQRHFQAALAGIKPALSAAELEGYARWGSRGER